MSGRGSAGPVRLVRVEPLVGEVDEDQQRPPSARGAPAQGWPPYSMTRLRMFHGAGSTDSLAAVRPSADQRAPAALGRAWFGPPHLVADRPDVLRPAVVRGGERGVDR